VLPEFDDVYVRAEVVELDVDPVRVGVDIRQGLLGAHPVADVLGRAAATTHDGTLDLTNRCVRTLTAATEQLGTRDAF